MTHLIRREMIALLGAGLALPTPDEAKALPSAGASRLTGLPGGISPRHLWIAQAGNGAGNGAGNSDGDELQARIRTPAGTVDRTGVRALRWLFRDWRDSDAAARVDVRLFDLLAGIQSSLTAIHDRPLRMVLHSGYRTRARNARIEGAAPNSQHVHGKAADFTLAGVMPSAVADVGDMLRAPGLGRYPTFTHVDVGPEGRRW